jgi:beta-lactamase regulating signal transducer with metallopeptidase domain
MSILLKATAMLAVAFVVDALLWRRGSAAARHLVWTIAMAGILVLPIASSALPSLEVRIPIARSAVTTPPIAGPESLGLHADPVANPIRSDRPEGLRDVSDGAQGPSVAWTMAPILLYVSGVLLLLARLFREPFVIRRLTRASDHMSEPEWQRQLARCAAQLEIGRPVRLLRSADEVMPMTFGTRTPTIVLPASADEWPEDRRRAVLLHELAHIARHDCFVQRITAIACACYWPHPGVWWGARRQRIERELACDDRVLAAGAGAREYAGHLLDLAHSLRAVPAPATTLAMARARQLETRLLAVLDAARNRAALRRRGLALTIAVSILVVLPISVLRAAVVPFDAPNAATASSSDVAAPSAAPAPTTVMSQAPQQFSGSWEIHQSRDAGYVQLTMRTEHWSSGHSMQLSRLDGLSASQITGGGSVRFASRREAGTFTFDGTCRGGYCGGVYEFAPNQAFASELARRGVGTPTPQQQYQLALADVGLAFLDELNAQKYEKPDLDTIVRAAQHGVNADYVKDMGGLGYRVGTVEALIRMRDHGVDAEFVRGLAANGYPHLSAEEAVRARDHGADPSYVKGMRDLGYTFDGDLSRLISARDHGIDPEFARGLAALGFKNLSFDELMKSRDHGVDPEYVRGLASLGYKNLTIEQLVQARDHGVDPEYVRSLADLGYKDVSLDNLIRMRDHGVDAEFVRRIQRRGDKHPTIDDLIDRRDRGYGDRS